MLVVLRVLLVVGSTWMFLRFCPPPNSVDSQRLLATYESIVENDLHQVATLARGGDIQRKPDNKKQQYTPVAKYL